MHYHAEIWTPKIPTDLESFVARMMGRHEQSGGFWDWYQVGGRWMGDHDNYRPELDPRNQEVCSICNGTGEREWEKNDVESGWKAKCRGCNACHGTGVSTKWPTNYAPYTGDVMEFTKVKDDLTAATLIIHKGRGKETSHSEEWTGKAFVKGALGGTVKEFLKSKGITDGYLITVDYHC